MIEVGISAINRPYPVGVNLQIGRDVYHDRSYTYTHVPSIVQGGSYIQTANNDKAQSGNPFLTFTLDQPSIVYVAHDVRISPKPSWLSAFVDTGESLTTSDTTLQLFKKHYPAGPVELGQNQDGSGSSMYVVIIQPDNTGGNGGMSDQEFLQSNLDAASLSQTPWQIPQGTYYIDEPLRLTRNMQISGSGPNFSTVLRPRNCATFLLDGVDVPGGYSFYNRVSNLMVWERDSDNPAPASVVFGKSYANIFRDVRFHEMKSPVVIDHQLGNNNRLINPTIYGVSGISSIGVKCSGGSLFVQDADIEACWGGAIVHEGGVMTVRDLYCERGFAGFICKNGQNGSLYVSGGLCEITPSNIGIKFQDCSHVSINGFHARLNGSGHGGWFYDQSPKTQVSISGSFIDFGSSPIPSGVVIAP